MKDEAMNQGSQSRLNPEEPGRTPPPKAFGRRPYPCLDFGPPFKKTNFCYFSNIHLAALGLHCFPGAPLLSCTDTLVAACRLSRPVTMGCLTNDRAPSPALPGRFLSTGPPGKTPHGSVYGHLLQRPRERNVCVHALSHVRLCNPRDGSPLSTGFSRQEH